MFIILYKKITQFRDILSTFFWRKLLKKSGKFFVYGKINIDFPENISIGDNTTLNHGVYLNSAAPITIGKHVRISSNAIINTRYLDVDIPYTERGHLQDPIIINNGAWIGSGAVILPGIKIGEGSIIGAGAVVTKDVSPWNVVAGVPAKVIRVLS